MSRYATCPDCGRRLRRDKDEWGLWDGQTYICDHCASIRCDEYDDDDMDVYEAALIWAANGKDEDYTFGYSEEELEEALSG